MVTVVGVEAIRLGNVALKTRCCRFHDNEEMEMAVREWLQVRGFDLYGDGVSNL